MYSAELSSEVSIQTMVYFVYHNVITIVAIITCVYSTNTQDFVDYAIFINIYDLNSHHVTTMIFREAEKYSLDTLTHVLHYSLHHFLKFKTTEYYKCMNQSHIHSSTGFFSYVLLLNVF